MTFRGRCSGSAAWALGLALFGTVAVCGRAEAQNPFAPAPTASPTGTAAPAAAVPAAPAPTGTAAPAANPFAAPAAPTAPATPAATATPTAPAAGATPGAPAVPAAPAAGANPFAAPATPPAAMPATPVATTPAAPTANPFGPATPAPAAATPTNVAAPAAVAPTTPALTDLPSVPPPGPPPSGGYRVLAAGVMTAIPSPVTQEDRASYHDIVEVLAEEPKFGERAANEGKGPMKQAYIPHDVWGLNFAFKPIRFIRLPAKDGKERVIWYMVYSVKNGPTKRFDDDEVEVDPTKLKEVPVDKPFLFIPRFELQSHDVQKTYREAIIPEAVAAIQQREDKNRKLLNTGEITGELPISTHEADRSVWGVATWEGVDPRTDRFSIFIYGLTNAFKWEDAPGAYQKGSPFGTGRTYHSQVLQLNFWRPSDQHYQHEDEIRFGIPGEVDYRWFYK
jgi:hypothetical protein